MPSKRKQFEVMTEITIAKTFIIEADDEGDAQQKVEAMAERAYAKLSNQVYSVSTDEMRIEIGDISEVEE